MLTASDDCSMVVITPSVDAYTIDICGGYDITYRWTATDNCGNESDITTTFNVLPDTESPTFDSIPDAISSIDCDASLPVQEVLTASDDCSTVVVSPSVDSYNIDICNGYDITYRWTATDNCGNISEITTVFNVLPDTESPTFDSVPDFISNIDCDASLPTQEILTAIDDCSTVIVTPSVDPYTIDICSGYPITYRWLATDNCGNTSEVTQVFNVLPDTEVPTFDSLPDFISNIDCDACLLYTSPSPRDATLSRMPSSA